MCIDTNPTTSKQGLSMKKFRVFCNLDSHSNPDSKRPSCPSSSNQRVNKIDSSPPPAHHQRRGEDKRALVPAPPPVAPSLCVAVILHTPIPATATAQRTSERGQGAASYQLALALLLTTPRPAPTGPPPPPWKGWVGKWSLAPAR